MKKNKEILYVDMNGNSLPSGCGELVQLTYEGTATQVTNIIIPSMHGETLDINYYNCQ